MWGWYSTFPLVHERAPDFSFSIGESIHHIPPDQAACRGIAWVGPRGIVGQRSATIPHIPRPRRRCRRRIGRGEHWQPTSADDPGPDPACSATGRARSRLVTVSRASLRDNAVFERPIDLFPYRAACHVLRTRGVRCDADRNRIRPVRSSK